ncbi:MAG: DUF4153 domain-containing protein [Octadecabacter sp.]
MHKRTVKNETPLTPPPTDARAGNSSAKSGPSHENPSTRGVGQVWQSGFAGVAALILLADFLFWGYRPGVSIGVFALAVFAVAALRRTAKTSVVKPAILMGVATLPVLEHVQTLSVCILVLGGLCALAWLRAPRDGGVGWILAAALKLTAGLPLCGLNACIDFVRMVRALLGSNAESERLCTKAIWYKWSVPVGGSLVLGALLMSANPVLEQVALRAFRFDLDLLDTVPRIMFWGGMGLLIWPLLNPPRPQSALSVSLPNLNQRFGFNGGSVLRALVVYNCLLGVQSILDLSILFGNVALPDGMSYATYAHRGAYPLMVTAVLAGLFSIAARPYLNEHKALKPLLVLWIGQNIVLSFSAAMRLDLYISEYGLTYLRIYAFIWIGLVGVGLVIVMWHVLRERSSLLLVGRLVGLGCGTLYVCAYINFAGVIAGSTIAHATDAADVDWSYLCGLGSTAQRAVVRSLAENPALTPAFPFQDCLKQNVRPSDWRETDFRTSRTQGAQPL